MAYIEINGKKIEAEPGSMIIEAADHTGIWIPRFCYHEKLSIAANCRMCLVEVEKAPKPLPACATPITDGMKIWTRSPKALMAQKAVMEFLLINHPLDCPICDQGGECELQDIALGYGKDASRFTEGKRSIQDMNIGPLIATDMTRCILCTRCVRFGTEIAGIRELGATGRGEHTEIGTFIEQSLKSEVSGNVIDLCPVGALTSKPFRFSARGWELTQRPSIAPHDCVGSNIYVHSRRNEVMRVVPRKNEAINEVWISDRDRFSYEALYNNRLTTPKIKQEGQWKTVSWADALEYATGSLQEIIKNDGPKAVGALASPNATNEEFYLLQKLMRGLGSSNIDHRLRQQDFRDQDKMPLFPNAGLALAEIEHQSTLLLIGSHIRAEQPILGLKLRKMVMSSGKVFIVNPIDFSMNFDVAGKIIVEGGDLGSALADIAKALFIGNEQKVPDNARQWLAETHPSEQAIEIAKQLQAENSLILMGALGLHHPDASRLIALANLISRLTGAKFGTLADGANSAGGWLTGCVPHRDGATLSSSSPGLNAGDMSEQGLKGYILMNIDPDVDCADGAKMMTTLSKASFTVALAPFESDALLDVADVLLPMCPFSENSGTLVNAFGQWQTFQAVVDPLGEARPAWKILRVLGNLFELEGFEQVSAENVLHDIRQSLSSLSLEQALGKWDWWCPDDIRHFTQRLNNAIIRIAPVPTNAADNIVRRASALQQSSSSRLAEICLNATLAQTLNLSADGNAVVTVNEHSVTLPVVINPMLPNHSVMIMAGIKDTISLGAPYAAVDIRRA
jgi:NADH-quinone oxidoreductase subunit G